MQNAYNFYANNAVMMIVMATMRVEEHACPTIFHIVKEP